ncbi:hypothetical protein KJ059_13050 [Myxococcota bacterium]|nr:hypothetical protein [Myxococcota bacterium]MCZ7616795.1 hypothetical protein [Myxococcota bacterium]
MHPLLESALSAMGISDDVPTLRHAAEFSERIVTESRTFLDEEAAGFRTRSDLQRLPRIRAMRDLGNELQQHLERVFFESSRLGRISRKYLSF